MRLSDMRGKKVITVEGESAGRIHEVICDKGRVVAVLCGSASLVERWTGRSHGRRVAWAEIKRIEA